MNGEKIEVRLPSETGLRPFSLMAATSYGNQDANLANRFRPGRPKCCQIVIRVVWRAARRECRPVAIRSSIVSLGRQPSIQSLKCLGASETFCRTTDSHGTLLVEALIEATSFTVNGWCL